MAKSSTNRVKADRGAPSAARAQDPAAIARRELVEWCRRHRLPVPDERRGQSSAR
jgi:hypothetical protein